MTDCVLVSQINTLLSLLADASIAPLGDQAKAVMSRYGECPAIWVPCHTCRLLALCIHDTDNTFHLTDELWFLSGERIDVNGAIGARKRN
ncbi:hypothetical protein HG531_010945 [Fusarium graminearum]|nr:hypothetical protein HG531_010945 [Fusarium graminearum]